MASAPRSAKGLDLELHIHDGGSQIRPGVGPWQRPHSAKHGSAHAPAAPRRPRAPPHVGVRALRRAGRGPAHGRGRPVLRTGVGRLRPRLSPPEQASRERGSPSKLAGGRRRPEEMYCQSCKNVYDKEDAGTYKECYEEASETEEELKREIDDLCSRLLFLRLPSPTLDASAVGHSDLLLHAIPASSSSPSPSADADGVRLDTPAVPAHRVILEMHN